MKKYLLGLLTLLTPFLTFAQDASDSGASLDAIFKKYTGWFVDFVFLEIHFSEEFQIPWVLIVLVGGAIYFTFYFKFINIRRFGTAIKVVSVKRSEEHTSELQSRGHLVCRLLLAKKNIEYS